MFPPSCRAKASIIPNGPWFHHPHMTVALEVALLEDPAGPRVTNATLPDGSGT
jgi:hypothetical protein